MCILSHYYLHYNRCSLYSSIYQCDCKGLHPIPAGAERGKSYGLYQIKSMAIGMLSFCYTHSQVALTPRSPTNDITSCRARVSKCIFLIDLNAPNRVKELRR